mmetsp:Transcript_38043/g.68525  ORF Transcript_38043/g.68525 Transcript_38043/m.68525 type:complete len:85 (+) Transcript_38043:189-443(+)
MCKFLWQLFTTGMLLVELEIPISMCAKGERCWIYENSTLFLDFELAILEESRCMTQTILMNERDKSWELDDSQIIFYTGGGKRG